MNPDNENLEQLLRQFVDQTQTQQMAEDIRHADNLFDANPVPSVSRDTIARVKQNVHHELKHAKHAVFKWVATAGLAAILLMGLQTMLTTHRAEITKSPAQSQPIVQNTPSRSNAFYLSDRPAAEMENEMIRLQDAMQDLGAAPYEPVNPVQINLNQIENELTSDSTDFWKG